MKKRLGFDLVILGVPASGKDTQAKLLEKRYALKPVESGKYFRSLAKKKTKTGDMLSQNFGRGKPAPVFLMKEFISANLKFVPKSADWVFIGNPRLKPEAQFLTNELNKLKRDYFAIFINLPNSEIWKRSASRKRDPIDLHYVKARIDYHKRLVSKTVNYFESLGRLKIVNGNQPVNKVNKDIISALNDYKKFRRTK